MNEGIYLAIGSNLGKREDNLKKAHALIAEHCGRIEAVSSIFQTAAWGKTDQPDFLNQVIEVKSTLNPLEILSVIMEIEKRLGRLRIEKWGARTIDIDILYMGATVLQSDRLTIPHPSIPTRRFVLEPLCELAPDFWHPVLLKQNATLLLECEDALVVTKIF
jgi:2-amino-4-hydroxy-6-hydroxymethyldihydropteridine diphosphokinase